MAITRGKSPIEMTAAADAIGSANGDSALLGRVFCVEEIRVVNGSNAGTVLLTDKSGGREILRQNTLAANAVASLSNLDTYFDGIYVDTLPSGATVYIYYR
jgi:hypothetical protein